MAVRGVERTAFGVGLIRAIEARTPRPLFDDPLAEPMLTGWNATVAGNPVLRRAVGWLIGRFGPGFYGCVVCRTRVIDDECRRAAADGIAQVVILGAGLDTRPYRLPSLREARVWELDLPAVQEAKKAAVGRVLGGLPGHVRYAPIDLAAERPGDVLAAAGADPGARTLVICEAVSLYLPGAAVAEILAYAGGRPSGSRLIFTYLPRVVAEDPRHAAWQRRLHWQTAFHPAELAGRAAGLGLAATADLGAEEYQARLLRPLGRSLDVFPGERILIAEKR